MYALTEAISELLQEPVTERGVNAMLRCPFHEDRSPSFSIHLEDGMWHCFGCQESGSIEKLYRLLDEEVSTDVRLARAKQRAAEPELSTRNFSPLSNLQIANLGGPRGRERLLSYLNPRGIHQATADAFGIGWDEDRDALSFPYRDEQGRVTGIKYRYSNNHKASESNSAYGIFGLEHVVGKPAVILCEGESDTLATHSRYGQRYGVGGTSGASVSASQWTRFGLHLLFARTVYLLYDADEAGDKCVATAMQVLGSDKCRQLRPPDGMDACDFYAQGGTLEELGLE